MRRWRLWFLLGVGGFGLVMAIIFGRERSVEELIAQLQAPSAHDRADAVRRLGGMGAKAAPAAPALIGRLNDEGTVLIRTKMAWEKEWRDVPYSVGSLARDSLTMIGKPAVPALIEALRSGDAKVRREVVSALGGISQEPDVRQRFGDSPEKWAEWWKRSEGKSEKK